MSANSVGIQGFGAMTPGYLYVLVHPSDPDLYKIGVTILHPEVRLAQHNLQYKEHAGRIVKETGQKWELRTYVAVTDPYWSERAFWSATGLTDVPFRGGVEVQKMDWKSVQAGLDAAREAGVRAPKAVPDWVHANAVWMNKRLDGRGISLLGHVRSKFGQSNFICSNGHQWRAVPNDLAEGDGCPQCGVGKRYPEQVGQSARPAILCLLVHPGKPGLIKIGLTYRRLEQCHEEADWHGWEIHRYRRIDESVLAEALIWELLGCVRPRNREPVSMDLGQAEQAFRVLVPRLQRELASRQRARSLRQSE